MFACCGHFTFGNNHGIRIYRIAGNIGGNYIWRIARKSKLADFNLAVFASPPTRLRDDVTLLRENKNWRILIWRSDRKPPIRQI